MKKVNLLRFVVFIASVVALSKFFEAGRLIASEKTFAHVPVSIFSLLIFVLTLFLMGYWIYNEEKEKNNLRIKFGPYEWLHKILSLRKIQK